MKTEIFIKKLVKDKNIGAITSTSGHIVKKIVEIINFAVADIIIEYGPGNGAITRTLLNNMKPNAILYVFETNKYFINDLAKIIDKRLIIINDDAEHARYVLNNRYNIEKADYIISTIPFTFIETKKRRRIIYKSFSLLKKNGLFITYQYSWFILNLIKKQFKNVQWKFVLLNIPPAHIMYGIK